MPNFTVRFLLTIVGFSSVCLCGIPREMSDAKSLYKDLVNLDVLSYMDQVAGSIQDSLLNANESIYRLHFLDQFLIAHVKPVESASEIGCNLMVKSEKLYFVFEFTVNRTAEEAFATLEKYKSKFYNDQRDILCLGINYQYVGTSIESLQDRLICNWMGKLYSENGTLIKTYPRQEDVYLRPASMMVNMKRVPVTVYYEIQDLIKRGGSSAVYVCQERRTGINFAAKYRFIRWPTHIMKERIFSEIDVMKMLTPHPNLAQLHDVFEGEEEIVLIVDLMTGGTLLEREKSIGDGISEKEVVNLIKQIGEGVKHMHERNIVHLDLHPGNIMCRTKKPCTEVKIIDFSKAGLLDTIKVDFEKGVLARNKHTAPEVMEGKRVGFYTDMWMLGVVTYFLISGTYPTYTDKNDNDISKAVDESQMFKEDAFNNISEEGKDFIRRLLIKNRTKRMTIHECLNHKWLTTTW